MSIDPDNATARAQLGSVYFYKALYGWGPTGENIESVKRLEAAALQLNPSLLRAHSLLTYVYVVFEWNWIAAQSEINKIRSIDFDDVSVLPRTFAIYNSIAAFWISMPSAPGT